MRNKMFFKVNVYKKKLFLIMIMLSIMFFGNAKFCYSFSYFPSSNLNNNDIIVTGDSYAGYFVLFEKQKDLGMYLCAYPGRTTEENFEIMNESFDFNAKFVLLSIGVNDHSQNISLEDFEKRINRLVSKGRALGKKIILHTYMNYDYSEYDRLFGKYSHNIDDYDAILQKIANNNSHVVYIDMHDLNLKTYLQSDKLHYNKAFYDKFYERLIQFLTFFS